MTYILTDKKDKNFRVIGTLENILEFLNFPTCLDYDDARFMLLHDEEYQNEYVEYSLRKTRVHVAERESREFVADVRDIMQGLAVIELFETEDDGNEMYEPGYYDIVDDDHNSLIMWQSC